MSEVFRINRPGLAAIPDGATEFEASSSGSGVRMSLNASTASGLFLARKAHRMMMAEIYRANCAGAVSDKPEFLIHAATMAPISGPESS